MLCESSLSQGLFVRTQMWSFIDSMAALPPIFLQIACTTPSLRQVSINSS